MTIWLLFTLSKKLKKLAKTFDELNIENLPSSLELTIEDKNIVITEKSV